MSVVANTSEISFRQKLGRWLKSMPVQQGIVALIVFNAVTLGLETSGAVMDRFGRLLTILDHGVLAIFVLELSLKLYAFGGRFFKNAWNVFDLTVIGIALVPASGPLAILRTLRVLRVLRLLSMLPRLRFVVEALLHSLPGIGSIALLMIVLYYVFAVMATGLFGEQFPDWFGTIGRSMFSLFQVMTLESWSSGLARPVMDIYPYAWLFFVPFILLATFTILNLFIAIIVNTMQTLHERTAAREGQAITGAIHADSSRLERELSALRSEMAELRRLLLQRHH